MKNCTMIKLLKKRIKGFKRGNIIQNLIDDDEIIIDWFNTMINNEIDEVEGTINNEQLWAKGTIDKSMIHYENIERLEKYKDFLINRKL